MSHRLAQLQAQGGVPRHVVVVGDEHAGPIPGSTPTSPEPLAELIQGAARAGVAYLTVAAVPPDRSPDALPSEEGREGWTEAWIPWWRAQGVRVRPLGEAKRVGGGDWDRIERETQHGDRLHLGLTYVGRGRDELGRIAGDIVAEVEAGRLAAAAVDEHAITTRLDTAGWPDPDLLIRVGGGERGTDLLLWPMAYTELFAVAGPWTGIGRETIYEAILDYQRRERRFGRVTP